MTDETWTVRESSRRTRSITAFREDGRLVVVVPATLSARQRRELVPGLVERFLAKEARRRAPRHDADLTRRAAELFASYVTPVTGGEPPPFGVRWVDTMQHRWGSCTVGSGEIRLSDRLRSMPAWVVDCVLLHEVTHLVEHDHGPRFWAIANRHPDAARARGFLEGVEHARASPG